jgi:hypothetical protein
MAFFAAGIRGITTGRNDAVPVLIDSAGQLGTQSSSQRFKTDIHDIGEASGNLMKLRPVSFHYVQQPKGNLDYGLIAPTGRRTFIWGSDWLRIAGTPPFPPLPASRTPLGATRHG